MGNDNSSAQQNDPYLNPNSRDRNLLNSIYSNNSSVVPIFTQDNTEANIKILSEQQATKKTKAYKTPVRLDRNTIKLEKNAMDGNIYYITFDYSSDAQLVANFYFNAEMNIEQNTQTNFVPSENFRNCVLSVNIVSGSNVHFLDQNVYFDMTYYLERKFFDNKHHDLIIEMLAFAKDSSNAVESVFCTFCKIYSDQTGNSFRIKPEMQKLKVNQSWFDIQDIYGFSSDNNECEICCSEKKNTIFLPCKHSYACKDCAIMIRVKGNNCPICRQSISDSVVIENIG